MLAAANYRRNPPGYAISVHPACDSITRFDAKGGLGRMYQLFGDGMDELLNEMNEALAA